MTFDEAIRTLQHASALNEAGYLTRSAALEIKKKVGEELVKTYYEESAKYTVNDAITIIKED